MTKFLYFLLGLVTGIIGYAGFGIFDRLYGKHLPQGSVDAPPPPPHPYGSADSPSLLYPSDPSNNQNLLGASHNIFVGKVLAQTGNKETQIGPRTQYKVQVIDNIKGEVKNIATVDLLGGTQNGKLITIEGIPADEYLLTSGTTYVFATRYNTEEDWYTLIPHPNARKVLSTDATLPLSALRALADKDAKVQMLRQVYPTEILDKADIANANTRNSFSALPPEAQATAQSRAEEARAILGKTQ